MDKKPTNNSVTKRYLQAMRSVIAMGVSDVHTKRDFALKVGMQPQRLNDIEKRRDRFVTAEQAARICANFGVSPEFILCGREGVFTKTSGIDRLSDLESRVAALERKK